MPKRTSERGVHFYRDLPSGRVGVRIDASTHTIRLHDDVTGADTELGALRTSLVSAMCIVGKALSVDAYERDLSPIGDAIVGALQTSAGALRDATLEAAIAEVNTTPLLYSAPFLDARWLWADAFRFRACRVAIANAEDLVIDKDGVDAAVDVVKRLGKWRELFLHGDGGKKAINSALNDFGETMPAPALWGLRNIALRRPRSAQAPLEILGWLGSLHDTAPAVLALAEAASDDEVAALLPTHGGARGVASFLAQGDGDVRTFLQLVRSAERESVIASTRDPLAFPLPSIPLPNVAGLRFIANARELVAEGNAMHHCVASKRYACQRGAAFIFHAERDGTNGTIHVDDSGHVVEARGPFNRASIAASWGAEQLAAWGAGLWSLQWSPSQLAWPPALAVPPGGRPLRSVRAIAEVYEAITQLAPARRAPLARWFRAATRGAVAGTLGVFIPDGALPTRTAWTVDKNGVIVSTDQPIPTLADARSMLAIEMPRMRHVPRALPIPPPPWMGMELIADVDNTWRFHCHDDAGDTLVVVDERGDARILSSHAAPSQAEVWRGRAAAWAHGFWGPRIGMERSTWDALRAPAVPPGAESLRSVAACHLVYTSTCDRRNDVDGALARFYERFVNEAVRGLAFLVVRDRAMGFVTVLDAKRRIVARTEDLLTPLPTTGVVRKRA